MYFIFLVRRLNIMNIMGIFIVYLELHEMGFIVVLEGKSVL